MATNKNSKKAPYNKNAKSNKKAADNKNRNKILAAIALVCVIVIGIIIGVSAGKDKNELAGGTYYADIVIKDHGTVTVELDADTAPQTVANFVNLAEDGFYDGLTFHRIMDGFMMQGGDPLGNGTGGSKDNVVGEFSLNGYENNISHTRGTISMARSQDYNSASSQFFIVHQDSTFLDGQYAGFGHVTEGMEIVDEICESSEPIDNNGTIPAVDQPVIETITIREAE